MATPLKQTAVKPSTPMTPHLKNLSINQAESFSTPVGNKENTPKKGAIQLNNSGMLQTSYTPKVVARAQLRVTQMLCMTPQEKFNTSTPSSSKDSSSIYRTPKSVLSEMNQSNLIDLQTPFVGPSKNMFLLDLMSPEQKTPTKVNPRSVDRKLTSTPKSSTKNTPSDFSTPKTAVKTNTLLKSAIKNTITQKNTSQSVFQKRLSIVSPADFSCTEDSSMESVIEISDSDTPHKEESADNTTVEVPKESLKVNAQKEPKNDLTDVYGMKRLMKTPGKAPTNDLSDVEGVSSLVATPKRSLPVPDIKIIESTPNTSVLNRTFEVTPANKSTVTSEIGDDEMMTAEQQFDSLSKMSTTKCSDNSRDSCERVLDWIVDTKAKLAKENNKDQILSARYSNVTPNESMVADENVSIYYILV